MSDVIFWDVDTQYDFIHNDGKLYVPGSEEILPALDQLRRLARDVGIRTVASADDHIPEHREISDEPDFESTFPPHCMGGSPGQDKVVETALDRHVTIDVDLLSEGEISEIAASGLDVLILKHEFDVFSNPNTEPLVTEIAPDSIVVFGVALDVCNKFAIEGMLSRFPEVAISLVTDACRAIDPERGKALVEGWRRSGVSLVTTEELTSNLKSTTTT